MASAKPPPVEKTMIMSLTELEKARDAMQKKKAGALAPPDASHQKTTVASALDVPDAVLPSETSASQLEEIAFEPTRISTSHKPFERPEPAAVSPFAADVGDAVPLGASEPKPLPAHSAAPKPAPAPNAAPSAGPQAGAAGQSLLEYFTAERVRTTQVDRGAVFDPEQQLHLLHAPLKNGQPHGDLLAWSDRRLVGAERFVDGLSRERLFFHPDGSWSEAYLFDALGLPRYRARQRGPNDDEFPSSDDIHPQTRTIEYLYDDHGGMEAFRCLDEYGDELSREVVSVAADQRTPQTIFDSLDEASQRWRAEGEAFKGALNAWLSERYALTARGKDADWSTGEPQDTRGDMERVVTQAIEAYNAEGRFDDLRADFPPAFEPFTPAFWERFARPIDQVVSLPDGSLLVASEGKCAHLADVAISELDGVVAVGRCPAHRFIALGRAAGVEVYDGYGGEQVASFPWPSSYGWLSERFPDQAWPKLGTPAEMGVTRLLVRPDGRGVVVVSREGVHALSAEGSQLLYPQPKQLKGYFEAWKPLVEQGAPVPGLQVDFPFAELSDDGGLVACGGRLMRGVFAQLEVLRWDEVEWVPHLTSFDKAFFPGVVSFHHALDWVAYAPVLYATVDTNFSDSMPNTVFRFDRARLGRAGPLKEFDGGLRVAPGIVSAIEPWGEGFLLGMRGQGYVWHLAADADQRQLGFLHLGGTISCLESSVDRARLYVGASTGQVICLRADDGGDPTLVSDMPLVDERRYLFWRSFQPMVW